MSRILWRFFSSRPQKLATTRKIPFEQEINQFLSGRQGISEQEWGALRTNLSKNEKNQVRLDNIIFTHFAMMKSKCNALKFTKQYLKALSALNVQPTLTNYDHLVRSYCRKSEEVQLTREEQADLLETCDILIKKSEMILPTAIMNNVVEGLCRTDQWKRALTLLNEMNEVVRPAKTIIAEKAFSEGELELGFQLLDELVFDEFEIDPKCCSTYWTFCRQHGENIVENVERMLRFLENKETILTKTCTQQLHDVIAEFGSSGHFARVSLSGECDKCKNMLESQNVSAEEYERLKEAIMEIALIGDNAFLKTTPDEVKKFVTFVENTAPYDIVLDGLNVAFRKNSKNVKERAETLASVVGHFAERKRRVLVIGREHMYRWPRGAMDYIRNNSLFFTVQNTSHDDPFTLYAALCSGPNTQIITNDLMRTHSFLIGSELKAVFKRWKQTNHLEIIYVSTNGKITFSRPTEHKLCCHKSNGRWHIPYVNDEHFSLTMNDRVRIEQMQWSCVQLVDAK